MKALTSNQSRLLYEFGPFQLDPSERLLLRSGDPVTLTPKAFDTLLALVENSGHLLEKDFLLRTLWPDTFVDENTLASNISALRKALGQDNGDQYIETVPKRGYRFVANVKQLRVEAGDLLVHKRSQSRIVITEESNDRETKTQNFLSSVFVALRDLQTKRVVLTALPLIGLTALLVYLWIHSKANPAEPHTVKSIAVLPFKTLAAQANDEYLELGLADALITRLGNLKQIVVRPTTAMQKFAANDQDPVRAGRELDVDIVLAGRVQRFGDMIRVTVQLIRVQDGTIVWTDKFDGTFTDIFAVQDSMSSQIALAMLPKLTADEKSLLAKHYTENAEAYRHYLKGRYFWNKRTPDGFMKAIDYFRQAIELDPNYALAYAGLADCYSFVPEPNEAKTAAQKALEIDEQLAEPHASLGNLKLFHDYDWPGAEREFKRSIELSPNYATAHHWYAYYLAAMGRFEEAIGEIERARDLDPISLAVNTDVGHIFYLARQYDQAIATCQKTLEMDPNFINAHNCLGVVYARKGMRDEAVAEMLTAESLKGERAEVLAAYKDAYAVSGWSGYWRKALDLWKGQPGSIPGFARGMALIYVELGENDQALEWLEKGYAQRPGGEVVLLKVDPRFDSLRPELRFAELLRRMNLG